MDGSDGKQCDFASEGFEVDDEDVILPNSPLSAYIQELKIESEINFLDSSPEVEKHEGLWNDYSPKSSSHTAVKTRNCEKLKTYLNCWYDYFTSPFSAVDSFLFCRILSQIKISGNLVDEDVTFLSNWVSDDTDLTTNGVTLRRMNLPFLSVVVVIFCLICCYGSDILWDMTFNTPEHLCPMLKSSLPIFGFLYCMTLTIIALFISLNSIKVVSLTMLCFQLHSISSTTQQIVVLLKKNIRLIQEAELTSRGFTSTSHSSIAERIEMSSNLPIMSSHRHYPSLRKSIFMWAKDLFLNFRFATLELLQTMQLGPDFDFSSHSLAMLDLEEFGNFMQYDLYSIEDLEKLLKVTDNFSISSLRTMFSLMQLQVSEYFKYLYLTLSFAKPNRQFSKRNYQIVLFKLLKNLMLHKNYSILPKVSESYKYYRCLEASSMPHPTSKPENKDHFALEIDLHNMGLHLKAALKRLLEAEEFLGTKTPSDIKSSNVSLKYLKNLMDQVNGEAKAFNETFQSYNTQLDTILFGSKCETPTIVLPQVDHCQQTSTIKAVIKCDIEQELKDEVFEDIATKSHVEDGECKENIDFEIKKNTEMASCLMHELKNVLVVKADEHRLREEKALAQKGSCPESSCEKITENNTKFSTAVDSIQNSETTKPALTLCEKDCKETLLNYPDSKPTVNSMSNFVASIAALANRRKITLGVSTDDCFIGDSSDSADDE